MGEKPFLEFQKTPTAVMYTAMSEDVPPTLAAEASISSWASCWQRCIPVRTEPDFYLFSSK